MAKARHKWYFMDDPDTASLGWWCFDTAEYAITIGDPHGHSTRRNDLGPKSYCILRKETATPVIKDRQQRGRPFDSLKDAQKAALEHLEKLLQASLIGVRAAMSE